MATNVGYLTCDTTISGDEVYTPFYAVEPILEFLPKDKIIWCPFDENFSAFVQLLRENGYKVVNSHLSQDQDFFTYEPNRWDVLVSNPPFSKKDQVIKRCYELGKPFMILLPIQSLQSDFRYKYFSQGCELLIFDKRINYHTHNNFDTYAKCVPFASVYICRNILPSQIIFRKIKKYARKLR